MVYSVYASEYIIKLALKQWQLQSWLYKCILWYVPAFHSCIKV